MKAEKKEYKENDKTVKEIILICLMPVEGLFDDKTTIVSAGLTVTISSLQQGS